MKILGDHNPQVVKESQAKGSLRFTAPLSESPPSPPASTSTVTTDRSIRFNSTIGEINDSIWGIESE